MHFFSGFCLPFFVSLFTVLLGSEEYERLYHPGYTHPDSPYNYAPVRPIQSIHAIAVLHSDFGVGGSIRFEQEYYEGAPVRVSGKIRGLRVDPDIVRPPAIAPPDELETALEGSVRSQISSSEEEPILRPPSFHKSPQTKLRQTEGDRSGSLHAIHIHQYGDLREKCASAGEHFNPDWTPHGGPADWVRHVGDLGNIHSGGDFWIEDSHISLFGRNNIIGRSVVIHESEDDYGKGRTSQSRKTGSAGRRIACGIIAKKDVVYHEL